jgi:hypothetical protein
VDQDKLSQWLRRRAFLKGGKPRREAEREAKEALASLVAYLDNPARKPMDLWKVRMYGAHWTSPFGAAELAVAQAAHPRLLEVGGKNRTSVEEALLTGIALAADARAVPFWVSLLALSPPRDAFAQRRRELSLAALAFLVISRGSTDALAALEQATRDERPDVQGAASEYIVRASAQANQPLLDDAREHVLRVAKAGSGFLPRFRARRALALAGVAPPFDIPEGVYTFEVKLGREVSRTIEVRSDQTLDHVCSAILDSLGWDSDHLYQFHLTGDFRDSRFVWPLETAGRLDYFPFDAEPAKDAPPTAAEAAEAAEEEPLLDALGQLGLVRGQKLGLLYDFGDSHQFDINVVALSPEADRRAKYPRLVKKVGRSPKQYREW